MKLYNRYILTKTLIAFFAIAALLIALIWFSRTITFVKYITENGVEIQQVFSLFLLILPWLMLFIIPISLFVAILIVYNRLITTNEISILKNSGLTKLEIGLPVKSIAASAVLFCFFISLFLMPYCNKKLRLARLNFENNYSNLGFSKGTFEVLKSLTIYVKDKNDKNELFGILLHDERNKDQVMTITAKRGHLLVEDSKLLLFMQEGTVQRSNYATSKSDILDFDSYVFNLSERNDSEVREMRWKAKEMYLSELMNPELEGATQKDLLKYKSEIQQRFTYPLMPFVLTIIALAAILRGGFNRHGNTINIIIASIMAVSFLICTITLYTLIETWPYLIAVLYFNFVFFAALGFYMLISNRQKIK